MLKISFIVVLIFGIVPYAHSGNLAPTGNPTQNYNPPEPTAPPPPPQKPAAHHEAQGAGGNKPSDEPKTVKIILPPKDDYDLWSFWISVALAAVGFAGIGVGLRTLYLIKVQAREMRRQNRNIVRQSAILERQTKATEDSAAALVSAERGWILASIRKTVTPYPYASRIEMPNIVKCELIFKNHGATPAIIESFSSTTKWGIPTFDFPLPPEYGERKEARIILGPQEDKVIGTVFPIAELPDGTIVRELLSIERAIFMGYVNYGGIFEGERETRFCFRLDAENDSFIPIGPAAYNNVT